MSTTDEALDSTEFDMSQLMGLRKHKNNCSLIYFTEIELNLIRVTNTELE